MDQHNASSLSEIILTVLILPDPDTVSVMQSKHGVDLPVTPFGRKSDTKANKGVKAFCS